VLVRKKNPNTLLDMSDSLLLPGLEPEEQKEEMAGSGSIKGRASGGDHIVNVEYQRLPSFSQVCVCEEIYMYIRGCLL
jgi:hypothetical protein